VSDEPFKILGISGSLRKGSFNSGLLRAAAESCPEGVDLEIFDLIAIPPYNADVESEGFPEPVRQLAERIKTSDAVLIASPEYNFGMTGVLKNALDWVSRPGLHGPLRHKPVAIMGASSGNWGTVRSQLQLRQALASAIEAYALLRPEVMVPRASSAFDDDGNLQDEDVRERVRGLIEALITWARRLDA
jgi:chromate reductase